ncbi:hypothetical protein PIB30_053967 [Stylosanthes scabra]|uniref:Uncharacterized protein n=1 Tax=Stylosanthes scabra TaxID=79078 RepID=A0ABU6YIU3_9FABA|nr:hypothetical protein [Stylosanthes scabra]
MFGPYSFINVVGGREQFDDAGRSRKNMVEVAVVMKILKNCFKETFIRNKEVTYDKFASLYWPHFNLQHTKKLDCSRVFIEIISHIKGGIQAMEPGEGELSRNDYLLLSENRASSLTKRKREMIYDV